MRKTFVFAMFALVLAAPAGFAKTGGGQWIGGGQSGVHVPSGDYGDLAKSGFTGGVFLDYMVNDMVALGANLDYHGTKAKDDYVSLLGATDDKLTTFDYGAHGDVYLMKEGVARPYITAGLGAYSLKSKIEGGQYQGEDTSTKFGFMGGAGIKFQPGSNPLGFGIEGAIHNISEALVDVNTGDKKAAQFFTVTGRVSFSFSDMSQRK